ncbi:putative leucine-rich repeat-containing protein DDB_G0290503 [Chironomus tepperi]|uniref:putative leucine-rich repeat-containing protein DDB_G0290503 n=1 Tax=Chironomus tepperi TaxID=113505 RepID=UPI00391F73A9
MDVQNFRMLQNFKFKEQKVEEKLNKQKSILQKLRMEYESLKRNDEMKTTSTEKLKQKKNLRSIYTFKLPVSKQKNKTDIVTPERLRNGWIQRPLSELPLKTQNLNRQRSRMIELGNSYSDNNRRYSSTTNTTRSVRTQHEMKREMLNRAKLLGNHYSFRFRQHHPLKVCKKSIDSYKKHEQLIKQKNEMEEIFRNGKDVPQIFPHKYSQLLNEIYRLEEELNLNHQFSDDKFCKEILNNSDSSSYQKLIDQLSYPIFDNLDVVSDKIQMAKAMERIDIGTILEATKHVEQRISKVFWSKDDVEEKTEKDLDLEVLKNEEIGTADEIIEDPKAIDVNNIETDFSNEEISLEKEEIESKSTEIDLNFEEDDANNEEQISIKSLEFDGDSRDVVIENEEIVYINEKYHSKNENLESNTEHLEKPSHEFFRFKNLILDISDQASKTINDSSSSTKATKNINESSPLTSSTSLSNFEDHPSEHEVTANNTDNSLQTTTTSSPIFSEELDSKLTDILKVFCKNYIEDLVDMPSIPKHHPSFADVRIKFIHETISNVDAGHKNDDIEEIFQVSDEICKTKSSILKTLSVESSKLLKMTSDAILDKHFSTYSSHEDGDYKSYYYSREMSLTSIKNPQSAVIMP